MLNYTFCAISKQFLSRSNWKILHLTEFFTQPAVVMVVTNMKCDGGDGGDDGGDDDDGGGDDDGDGGVFGESSVHTVGRV